MLLLCRSRYNCNHTTTALNGERLLAVIIDLSRLTQDNVGKIRGLQDYYHEIQYEALAERLFVLF